MHLQKIVKNPEKTEDLVKGLDQIHAQADRLADIIKRVREYIYRNDETIEDFISLRDIIENVLVFCVQRLKNHGIELKLLNVGHKYVTCHRGQF
jgi:C4-dicarboxylate-specific signal transduction histidine kinase